MKSRQMGDSGAPTPPARGSAGQLPSSARRERGSFLRTCPRPVRVTEAGNPVRRSRSAHGVSEHHPDRRVVPSEGDVIGRGVLDRGSGLAGGAEECSVLQARPGGRAAARRAGRACLASADALRTLATLGQKAAATRDSSQSGERKLLSGKSTAPPTISHFSATWRMEKTRSRSARRGSLARTPAQMARRLPYAFLARQEVTAPRCDRRLTQEGHVPPLEGPSQRPPAQRVHRSALAR